MSQRIVLTFTSPDRPGIVEEITSVVVRHGGNWEESRSARLAGEFAGLALVTAPTEHVDALRNELDQLSQKNIQVRTESTNEVPSPTTGQSMHLTCEGADHEGIVRPLTAALSQLRINVDDMATSIKPAPTTGTPLFYLECNLRAPADCDLDQLEQKLAELETELDVQIELAGVKA
ncbi:MAG: ACT domain-containing protein [Planctomycetota bacterium]